MNADDRQYTLAWIKDVECLFSEERINDATVPDGFHKYDIRHADNDWGQPCTLEHKVTVNYYGSVLLMQELDFEGKDCIDISGDEDFIDSGDIVAIDEFNGNTPSVAARRTDKSETMRVLIVEPMKAPRMDEIPHTLAGMQDVVGGTIQAVYPFKDAVAIVYNDDGKLIGLQPNRILRDEYGSPYDYLAGTFFVCGLGDENFASLPPDMEKKYKMLFWGEMLMPEPKRPRHAKPKAPER